MPYYRQDRITKQIFRRTENGSEEYMLNEQKWEHTSDAVEAFYDSSDTMRITEIKALTYINQQLKKIGTHN